MLGLDVPRAGAASISQLHSRSVDHEGDITVQLTNTFPESSQAL